MTPSVSVRHERRRGCGFRQQGGLYFVGETVTGCTALPVPLHVCPTCHAGIKFSRGFTWVDPSALLESTECEDENCMLKELRQLKRCGLLWVGESFYPTPAHFLEEARTAGASRRIPAVPRTFKVGQDWILLAHRKAVSPEDGGEHSPGVFSIFRPSAVEYVVRDDDDDEKVQRVAARGVAPVRVVPMTDHLLEKLQSSAFGASA